MPTPPFLQYDQALSDLGRLVAAVGTAVEAAQQEVAGPEAAASSSGPSAIAKNQQQGEQQEAAVAGPALLAARAREHRDAARQLLASRQACPAALQQQAALLLQAEEALATLGCAHLACGNCAGASEAGFKGRRCGGCHLVRYCGEACRDADWARHRKQCRRLQRRGTPGQGQGGAERQPGTVGVPAGGGGAGA